MTALDRLRGRSNWVIAMIIDREGNILESFYSDDGIVIKDGYYSICLEYSDEDKTRARRIRECKDLLSKTDYKTLKYAEGLISEEEYESVKMERAKWRKEINDLEEQITIPSITDEEKEQIEARAEINFRLMQTGANLRDLISPFFAQNEDSEI